MLKHVSIRTKIALGFSFIALLSIVLVISNQYYEKQVQKINLQNKIADQIEYGFFEKEKIFRNNISDARSNEFQEKSSEELMNTYNSSTIHITKLIADLKSNFKDQNDVNQWLNELNLLYQINQNLYHEFIREQKNIGHQSYGLIGDFRKAIHSIEKNKDSKIPTETLLEIRRSEKDYLLRKDVNYAYKVNTKIDALMSQLPEQSEDALHLETYRTSFNQMVASTQSLFDKNDGLIAEINKNVRSINERIDQTQQLMEIQFSETTAFMNTFQRTTLIVLLVLMIGSIYVISKNIAKPIVRLDNALQKFVASDYQERSDMQLMKRGDEIGSLMRNFNQVEKDIVKRFNDFKEKSEHRQKKLQEQNEKIRIQKFLLQEQRNKLDKQNKEHKSSLYYAQKLQRALLPNKSKLQDLLGSHGLMYMPKDIVSGDFYWTEKRNDLIYFAVGDCTGHGIPGAFLSVLCINYLNTALFDKNILLPNEILNFVSYKVTQALNQSESSTRSSIKDGMDIALCCYNKSTGEFYYSGAQRPLLILREEMLIELKPDKNPVGWSTNSNFDGFQLNKFKLEFKDRIFLFSDGYADQFGGESNKKLKYRKLKDIIKGSRKNNINDQLTYLNQFMMQWKGYQNEQIDDICLLGIEYEQEEEKKSASIYNLLARENQKKNPGNQSIYS